MARTAEGAALTQQHRSEQLAVRASMLQDLQALWRTVNPVDLARTIGPFAEAAAVTVRSRHQESAQLGRRYFRDFRIADGIGQAEQLPDEVSAPPVRIAEGLLRGAALKGIIEARRSGFSPGAAAREGFVRTSGQATSLTLNGGRNTVRAGVSSDREALGWIRITSGQPCHFCAIVASRAETDLYSTAKTADFMPHDHCVCTIEPMYPDSELPEANRRFREMWDQTRDVKAFRRLIEGRE